MGYVQREIDKLFGICYTNSVDSEIYQRAYYMKQALSWALDPDTVASPTALMHRWDGVPEEGTDGTGIRRDVASYWVNRGFGFVLRDKNL